jgi:hypothetical protein
MDGHLPKCWTPGGEVARWPTYPFAKNDLCDTNMHHALSSRSWDPGLQDIPHWKYRIRLIPFAQPILLLFLEVE